ncbi:hypothetical protein DFH28DRAFT_925894 [Melampsora americana]|nr:hypothetical protein DFH28DRAFT_925894 [Melampsora americana]
MSAQNFADEIANLDVLGKNQTTDDIIRSNNSGESKGRTRSSAKGKKGEQLTGGEENSGELGEEISGKKGSKAKSSKGGEKNKEGNLGDGDEEAIVTGLDSEEQIELVGDKGQVDGEGDQPGVLSRRDSGKYQIPGICTPHPYAVAASKPQQPLRKACCWRNFWIKLQNVDSIWHHLASCKFQNPGSYTPSKWLSLDGAAGFWTGYHRKLVYAYIPNLENTKTADKTI